ncbi:hypothetical protein [Trichlorobacter lovleyi]|uniref:hypothetical protein n=1 Tax=Trichlorobacter lovleyi TaxID=313985 RepID=UPI0023F4B73E|nr:hypothetical protein [Trichlorobacter lovleyi]
MKKYDNLDELIEILKVSKADIEEKIQALQTSPRSFEEELILRYIETRSTVKAAEFAKSKNIRSPKGTVFSGSNVSNIIRDGSKSINPILLKIAREIFGANTRAVVRAYG